MGRIPLLGGAYSAASLIASAQRSVNLYPERNPQEVNPPAPVTNYPRPGLTPLGAPPAIGNGRCVYGATDGTLYAVVNQSVYYIDRDWKYNLLGPLIGNALTPAYMADNGTDIVVVDGSAQGYDINMVNRTMLQIGDPNFLGADRVDFIDYFLIFNQPNSPNWYSTLVNSVAFNALFFGTKTRWPDNILAAIAVEDEVWVIGPKKSEVWFNAGTTPFAFQVMPGNIIEQGCAAKYSIAKQDVNLYWLSQSPEGRAMVVRGRNHAAQRISNHAIEEEFLSYPRIDDAIGNCFQIRGHSFYSLHFPTADKTWVFDEAFGQTPDIAWHESNWTDINGILRRSRACFYAVAYDTLVALDWQTGQLYKVDTTNFTDNGIPLSCIRSFQHEMADDDERISFWKLIADIEVGNGTGTQAIPTIESPWSLAFSPGFGPQTLIEPPLISARMSLTRGESWGNRRMQPMGAAGLYRTRPTWNRWGMASDMVIEFSWSTPMKTALNGAFLVDPEKSDS